MAMTNATQGRITAYRRAAQTISPDTLGDYLSAFSNLAENLESLKTDFSNYYGSDADSLAGEIQILKDQYTTIGNLMRDHFTVLSDAIDAYAKSTEANFTEAYQRLRELDKALEDFISELGQVGSVSA